MTRLERCGNLDIINSDELPVGFLHQVLFGPCFWGRFENQLKYWHQTTSLEPGLVYWGLQTNRTRTWFFRSQVLLPGRAPHARREGRALSCLNVVPPNKSYSSRVLWKVIIRCLFWFCQILWLVLTTYSDQSNNLLEWLVWPKPKQSL